MNSQRAQPNDGKDHQLEGFWKVGGVFFKAVGRQRGYNRKQ